MCTCFKSTVLRIVLTQVLKHKNAHVYFSCWNGILKLTTSCCGAAEKRSKKGACEPESSGGMEWLGVWNWIFFGR